jgi:PRTRC genetic system protein E
MFFQTMFQMMSPGVDYNLTISRTENKMTVLVMPKVNNLKDTAQNKLVPFTVTATATEMDAGFFAAIGQPVTRTAGLLTNMAEHEKQTNKVAASSKVTKEETGKAEKESKTGKKLEEKKSKHQGSLFEIPSVMQPETAQPAGYHHPSAQPHQPYPGYPAMPLHGGHPGMFTPATPSGYGGYPHHAGGYPNGYSQNPYAGGNHNPGYAPGDGCYNPKDYEDMPDIHATHIGQLINPQPQAA